MQFDVAVVHNQVFAKEALQYVTINYIKLVVASQTAHQLVNTLFVVFPLLAMLLNLNLSLRQLLVEFLQVVLGIEHLTVLGNLLE